MNTLNSTHTIGIWGFGLTGKAAVEYFHAQGFNLVVMDKKQLTDLDCLYLAHKNIPFFTEHQKDQFFAQCNFILPSPGIDLRPYDHIKNSWLNELDLFFSAWHKPIIAITGSIGKTTITHLLSTILQASGVRVATGGNIGTPMFDLLAQQENSDMALLEVSSFQLEHGKTFAPSLAILTNFYPNHLDRHSTEQEYLQAKATLFNYQKADDQALVPLHLKDQLTLPSIAHFFSSTPPTADQLRTLHDQSMLFYLEDNVIKRYNNGVHQNILNCEQLPPLSFEENWLIICATLIVLNKELPNFLTIDSLSLPEHRLEKLQSINGVDFYNDSKSTTMQSTLAAVNRLQKKPLLLLLGGLGKGVNREPLIKDLQGKVKKIYCFGKEAELLKSFCDIYAIPSAAFSTLDHAVAACYQEMILGEQVLLSPAGSSFDLFANYSERGNYFKKLVGNLQ